MTMSRAPWLLAGLLGSAMLLTVVLTVLAWREGPGPLVKTLEPADAQIAGGHRFPPEFGRLADLVPFAGGVSPVAAAVVPVAHGPEFRDADWVLAQVPESWTLQVLASRDESAVKRFLSGLENRADFVYFMHTQDGQAWYVVTTGSFSSRELALGVAGQLPLPDGARPFPRSLSAYQASLQPPDTPVIVPVEAVPSLPGVPEPESLQP